MHLSIYFYYPIIYNSAMKKALIIITLIAISFAAGRLSFTPTNSTSEKLKITRINQVGLSNPLLDCETYSTNEPNTTPLKAKIDNYLKQNKNLYNQTSVYFRDLNNGPWFGINEKAQFAPVSLLKVPVMIAYLKIAETDSRILQQTLPYNGKHILEENISGKATLSEGQKYTLDELITRMISLSDNIAFEILVNHIQKADLKTVHQELGLIYPDKNTPDDYVNVKDYAGLFRILYNSTYLNREMSERGLGYLLNSDFKQGIKAGIPKGVKAALKFGIKDDSKGKQLKQIHDCGIVYAPKKPYLLCIMTKGKSKLELPKIIKDISAIVYQYYAN